MYNVSTYIIKYIPNQIKIILSNLFSIVIDLFDEEISLLFNAVHLN